MHLSTVEHTVQACQLPHCIRANYALYCENGCLGLTEGYWQWCPSSWSSGPVQAGGTEEGYLDTNRLDTRYGWVGCVGRAARAYLLLVHQV